ncbi:MAG: PEGA domain-containing protein [Nitrospirota bacterium]
MKRLLVILFASILLLGIISPLFADHRGRGRIYIGPVIRVYPYDPYWYPYDPYDPYWYRYPPPPPNWGYVDTDVEPEEAKVYLDGKYIGIADDYDGFPRYLSVPLGSHKIEFRMEGYETFSQEFYINPGQMINIDMKMIKGNGMKREAPKVEEPAKEHGIISLELEPVSAEVFVDGTLVGTGEDLKKKGGELELSIGRHRLEFKKAGHKTQAIEIEIKDGKAFHLGIRLERE